MSKVLWLLGGLITSIILGVNFIQPESKVFSPKQYYVGNQSEEQPDYKRLYNANQGGSFASIQQCDIKGVPLDGGTAPYKPTGKTGFLWFWPTTGAEPNLLEKFDKKKNPSGYKGPDGFEGFYVWEVPKGTKLVSIGDSNLVASTQNSLGVYPKETFTKGVHMSIIVKSSVKKEAFKVTYGSMERWWCQMHRHTPDEYLDKEKKKPRYGHTINHSDKDTFYAGSVIGLAGGTGAPDGIRSDNKAYVFVQIEKTPTDDAGNLLDQWSTASLKELYGR